MKRTEFICLSAASMVLTALGIDVMLPAFSAVRAHFQLGPESTATSQIISFFFMGQIAQLFFGIWSDRAGRLPVLRVGFPLYIIGGIAAAFAPSLAWMYVFRFLAGMGAAAVFMTTIASVRDRFSGDTMARTMSLILAIFLFTPILAPFLGQLILFKFSWRAVFLAPPCFAVAVFLWSFRLKESLAAEHRVKAPWSKMFGLTVTILRNKTFLRYATITTILFTAFSAYIASSERIVSEIFGTPQLFALLFAATGLFMSICTLLNAYLAKRFGARKTLHGLLTLYVFVALVMVLPIYFFGDPPSLAFFFVTVSLITGINLAIEPNSSALALEPMGAMAGMAASLYGTLFFFVGASIGSIISQLLVDGVMPLAASFLAIGVIALFLSRK